MAYEREKCGGGKFGIGGERFGEEAEEEEEEKEEEDVKCEG